MNRFMGLLTATVTGAVIGGGTALAFAPKTGLRTRKLVFARYRRLKEEIDRLSVIVGEQAVKLRDEVVVSATTIKNEVKQSASTVVE